jgi:hypothetical protein
MNAVALRTERAVADYLRAKDWGETGIVSSAILVSYGRGALSTIDEEAMDTMPDLPRIIVRATGTEQAHRLVDVHEVTVDIDLQIDADDELESGMLDLVTLFESFLITLPADDWDSLDTAATASLSGYDCQYALPGTSAGFSIQGRSRVYSRTMRFYGRVVPYVAP